LISGTKPDSPVYYRYGAFKKMTVPGADQEFCPGALPTAILSSIAEPPKQCLMGARPV
jgi:hypothetical protein